ncbi:MAG: hypothetical protein KTR26_15005 [Flammeovirgaceae bacterium]|nr:hypothetical protein [Flammeovirgaceae bacterium]
MKILLINIFTLFCFFGFTGTTDLKQEPSAESYGTKDWLLDGSNYRAGVYKNNNPNEIVLTNGLIRRIFLLADNAATIAFDNLITGESIIRGIKPEAEIKINGVQYDIGGLKGQPNYAFFKKEWIRELKNDPASFQFVNYEISQPVAPFQWKRVRHHADGSEWPPKGIHLTMNYELPNATEMVLSEKLLPSNFGRKKLEDSGFKSLDAAWKVYTSRSHLRSSFENEGKMGEIYTPEHTSVFVERPLPEKAKIIESTIDIGTDLSTDWGPGMALVFANKKTIKFYIRTGENDLENGKVMFGLWDGEKGHKIILNGEKLDLSKPLKLRFRLDGELLNCEAQSLTGNWKTVKKIRSIPSKPQMVRIGKMDSKGNGLDHESDKGDLVRLHILNYAAYGDYDQELLGNAGNLQNSDIILSVHYELYDGIPVMAKWITVKNNSDEKISINHFTSEIIAAVEYMSPVEQRGIEIPKPNLHVETDYAFSGMTHQNANNHVVHWELDPDYDTQVNYLKLTPCLLKVKPKIGPNQILDLKETFNSFRTFILPHDSYSRERQGLAQRKMYRILSPWATENPLMMHARFADWERVKTAIDQCAEVGFEMIILTFGSGFEIEDDSPEYLSRMKKYADYAKSKGIEIGGYSLLASRKVGNGNDVVMPEGQRPTFGNSPCIGSKWGKDYFRKLYQFYEKTGFTLLEHDGSYPGDFCISENHPGHFGYEDSRWNQYEVISDFYKWSRENGVYLNIPDYYYLTGSNKCAMGYREVNWSLPRNQQLIHTRQNIYDGTWTKAPSMGWMFVPLTQYHGGGDAATIEPLNEHIDHYQMMMVSNLDAGVQACYRGPRLYDTEETKTMVKNQVNWYNCVIHIDPLHFLTLGLIGCFQSSLFSFFLILL